MSLEDLKRRFADEIELRARDDKYIDRNEEREILQIAIQQGIGIESAHHTLIQACEHHGYVIESLLLLAIKDQVEVATRRGGRIHQEAFIRILRNVRQLARGKKSDREIKKMVVQVMEDTGNNNVKTGWFSDWYASLKRQLGMA
jgi:hypothetical protein